MIKDDWRNSKMRVQMTSISVLLRKCHFCVLTMSKQLILGLKIFLVMPFFIKITFLTMCQDHFCTRRHSNRAFEAFGFLLPPCCGYKKPTTKNTLFEWFLIVQKWSWHIVSKVNFMKNVFTKKIFSDPKSADLT